MQHKTKLQLATIHQLCDAQDKSTEYMIVLMQDITGLSLDTIMSYLELKDKTTLFKEVMIVAETISKLDKI